MLLNFLDVRVVINGNVIYPLRRDEPVVITLPKKPSSLVATDGYHISPPLQVECAPRKACHLYVVCAIDDGLFYTGLLLLGVCALVGVISDILLLKFLSFLPLLYFLFHYYIRRRAFLQVRMAG